MGKFICQMKSVRKAHNDKITLNNVTMASYPGAKIGVIGPNGAGKSSILKIMVGLDQPSNGEAFPESGTTISILLQEPPLNEERTVCGNVKEGLGSIFEKKVRFEAIAEEMVTNCIDELMEEMDELQEKLNAVDTWELDSKIEWAMNAPRCSPADEPITHLSGDEHRRVALAKLLLSEPDLLLLDEPTSRLGAESVLWLEQHLAKYPGVVLVVTRDRHFLSHVAGWICEVGRDKLYPYESNYSTYLGKKAERPEVAGKKDIKLQKRLKNKLAQIYSDQRACQTRNKARLERYEQVVEEAEQYKKLDFEEIQIPAPSYLGNQVVGVKDLEKGFDGRVLTKNPSFTLPRSGIVGMIGPNGAGKSTLFKTIVGLEQPDPSEIKVGQIVQLSYVDQGRKNIDPEKTVWEVVFDGLDCIAVGQNEVPFRAYPSAPGFKGADQQKLSKVFSDGERNRLDLALTLKQGGNLILLDEPTNDLGIETLSSLENALQNSPGCAVVISHDRRFLSRTCTCILAWGGNFEEGKWFWSEDDSEGYGKNKAERYGEEVTRPPHVTHRRLTR